MGSGERKRCSNIAPVRRLRSLAWMKARKLPGVRCSTLKTECRSLLCLMIMPGRSWVAGIDIAEQSPYELRVAGGSRRSRVPPHTGPKQLSLQEDGKLWEGRESCGRPALVSYVD